MLDGVSGSPLDEQAPLFPRPSQGQRIGGDGVDPRLEMDHPALATATVQSLWENTDLNGVSPATAVSAM